MQTSVTDIDGNVYKTITIGSQTWITENLKVTKYNDNTLIPFVIDQVGWAQLTTPGYCWYNNDQSTYGNTYGALYNWYVVDTSFNGHKNICPTGWHVPTDNEWSILTQYLGDDSLAGGKLKETDTTHWNNPNTGANNITGFTALPGGIRATGGAFSEIGRHGFWWCARGDTTQTAWCRVMHYNYIDIVRGYANKKYGFSVRCIKNLN